MMRHEERAVEERGGPNGGEEGPTTPRRDDGEKLEVDYRDSALLAQCQDKGTVFPPSNHSVHGTRMQGSEHIGDYI